MWSYHYYREVRMQETTLLSYKGKCIVLEHAREFSQYQPNEIIRGSIYFKNPMSGSSKTLYINTHIY